MITVEGNEAMANGARVRAMLDALERPRDEARMNELFKDTMLKLEKQQRSWGRQIGELLTSLAAGMIGA
jgi:hypothetical protein